MANRTLTEEQQLIAKKTTKIQQTIQKLNELTGISIDVFESIDEYQEKFNKLNQSFNEKWAAIAQANKQNGQGTDFEEIDEQISELLDLTSNLYREATTQNYTTSKLRNLNNIDLVEFKAALTYHKSQSQLFLTLLFITIITSIIVIFSIFTFDNKKLFPIELIDLVKTDTTYRTTIIFILIQLGGKLTIIFGLAWVIKFLGNLHSKHSKQSIIYQDRIAGLTISELIITSGRTSVREQILKQMSDTYLNDKENAFREIEKPKEEEIISKKEIGNLLKTALENRIPK